MTTRLLAPERSDGGQEQSVTEDRRANTRDDNKPSQYQKGYTEFYKLRFKVTPDVLIPRPETELLVDEILNFLASSDQVLQGYQHTILDIGTGSGNIAISVAKHLPTLSVETRVIATDISLKALKIAKQNAKLHHVEDNIIFVHSNLLNVIAKIPPWRETKQSDKKIAALPLVARNDGNIDIIVANLPYIPTARIPYLDSSVKDFEPWIALDGGEDGFDLYRKLFQQTAKLSLPPRRCKPKLIIGEIDYTHEEIAQNEAKKYFPEAIVEVKTDLAHKQRILKIKFDI